MANDDLKAIELFNAHQQSTQERTEFLAKSVFLISGAALTLSINLFLGEKAPALSQDQLCWLSASWIALFASIVGYVLVFALMVIRDYRFGENWRQMLYGKKATDPSNEPGWLDGLMWILGFASVSAFVFGIGTLARLSTVILGAHS